MAENVVSLLIDTLGNLLKEKIAFLNGVEEQVQKLRDELVRIKCFLKDADQKQDDDERISNWVSEMRAVSYDAEDVIEIFVSKMEFIEKKPFLKKFAYFPMKMHWLNKVGKEIEAIQSRIIAIEDSRERYGIRNLGEGTNVHAEEFQLLRRSSAFSEDKNIVGIEEKAALLISQLLKEDSARCVFSITGMGGVGKTTLARKIYNHADVQTQFCCRAWVCVSERYNFRDIMKTIIKQVKSVNNELLDELEKMQDQDLEQKVYECLQGKRYLVVLDDIWQEEGWDCLARVFPDENKGNRLLLTSRKKSVAQHADPRHKPYELETLEQDESWLLFIKKAFADNPNGRCPPHFEHTGREIVSKCGGLPLAIAIIGSLLLQKESLSEWKSVLNDINSHLSRAQNGVSPILELSYRDLPPNLKFCFNYLGFFPEDHEISVQKLTHMWIAEGIVLKSDGEKKCLEDIAADYMEQLLNRNMVQVAEITFDDRVKSCRIHDLLRDLAIRKAKDENFLQILASRGSDDGTSVKSHNETVKSRYLAVHCHPKENPTFSIISTPHLRSLLFFNMSRYVALDWFNFGGVIFLRVLHLDDTRIDRLPKEIGEISLLRYLGLRGTGIKELPRSLGRLQHLQTLDVFNSSEVQIPNVIWKLECLRHLYLYNDSYIGTLKIEGLKSLRTLSRIHYYHVIGNNLMNLTSLHKMGIWIEASSEIDILCTSLSALGNLYSLNLYAADGFPSLVGIHDISHLSELKLSGELKMLPHLPPNLSRLSLISTKLKDDPIPILAELERLSVLKLDCAYIGKKMTIPRNGFYQLNFLEFRKLQGLEEVKIEKGALPALSCLRIRDCYSLKMLPEELTSMTSLKKLELVNMPKKCVSRLEDLDSYKVCQVPTVRIFEQVERPPFDYYRGSTREHRASAKLRW